MYSDSRSESRGPLIRRTVSESNRPIHSGHGGPAYPSRAGSAPSRRRCVGCKLAPDMTGAGDVADMSGRPVGPAGGRARAGQGRLRRSKTA